MTDEEETLACGQNNQGFGQITVMSDAQPTTRGTAAAVTNASLASTTPTVSLAGSGLVTGRGVEAVHGTPTVTVGQTVQALVRADATSNSSTISHVLVFDGPQTEGNLVADATLDGADTTNGGSAYFTWVPHTAGIHVLHELLLHADGTSTQQTLTLRVLAHGPATRIAVTPAHTQTHPGRGITYTATGYDQYNNRIGNLTKASTFIIAGGRCVHATCSAVTLGDHTITARDGTLHATAALHVSAAATRVTTTHRSALDDPASTTAQPPDTGTDPAAAAGVTGTHRPAIDKAASITRRKPTSTAAAADITETHRPAADEAASAARHNPVDTGTGIALLIAAAAILLAAGLLLSVASHRRRNTQNRTG
jgi:hypothetical protein